MKESDGMINEYTKAGGQSVADMFAGMFIDLFTAPVPTDVNGNVETGTKLGRVTVNADTFNPGTLTNGLNFGDLLDAGEIGKATDEDWEFIGLADGNMAYGVAYANAAANMGDESGETDKTARVKKRFLFTIGTAASNDIPVVDPEVKTGRKGSIDVFSYKQPAYEGA